MQYTLKPGADGYLTDYGSSYKSGDTIFLSGKFKAIAFYNLVGSAAAYIKITNAPNEVVTIGDITWAGGSWGHGLALRGCKYVEILGSSADKFIIPGSSSTVKNSGGAPVRAAYWNVILGAFTDNIKIHDVTIENGGTPIVCKTDVSIDPKTWFTGANYLENFEFYNLIIRNCMNEGMYIGHTATYWEIDKNIPIYSGTITSRMKQPIKLRNVSVYNNKLDNIGNDGIQIAAADNVKVKNNKITNWGANKDFSHNGGILIGGRVVDFELEWNELKDGWGEFIQIYADAGKAIVKNNLAVNNELSGIGLKGAKGLLVQFSNNSILNSGDHAFRINGTSGGTEANLITKNIIVQKDGKYVYLENGGKANESDNKKFKTLAEAGLSPTTYVPITGSASIGYGFSGTVVEPPVVEPPIPPAPTKITISSNELAAFLKGLKAGSYELNFEFDSNKKKITLTVQ